MRLLLGDAYLREIIDQHFGLNFEFAGQFVNPDLVCVSHSNSG